jgi:hypothetical protein
MVSEVESALVFETRYPECGRMELSRAHNLKSSDKQLLRGFRRDCPALRQWANGVHDSRTTTDRNASLEACMSQSTLDVLQQPHTVSRTVNRAMYLTYLG